MIRTKGKKAVIVLVVLISVFLIIYIGINLYCVFSTKGKVHSPEETKEITPFGDAILVLGAGVKNDGSPSHMLQDRLLTALQLYEKGVCETILVSGDHGSENYDEVNIMKSFLIQRGVPSERIFMDHAGFSTYDSLYRAKEVFGAKSLVIVTQEYHTYRSVMIGEHLGIRCKAVAAPILSVDATRYTKQSWYSFRESIARCKDFFNCIFKPLPKYLGESISLEENGDVTNDGKSR